MDTPLTPSLEADGTRPGNSRALIAIALYVLLLGFAFQGTRHLWQPDEGYNAAVACEMMDSGDLLIQRLDGNIYLGKPPMYIWCSIPSLWLFGRNEFGVRAFCGLCYVLTALITGLIGRSMWGRREGILAALIYATMVLPFGAANVSRPDTPLVLATTATLYCFWRSVMPGATRVALWKMLMCAAIGWGFEMKSTAVLVPVAPLFVYLLLTRQAFSYFATVWSLVGMVIFAAIGLSWYVYTARVLPGAGAYLWDSQVLGRLVTDTYGRHAGFRAGLELYLPALLVGTLPWLPIWIPLGRRISAAQSGKKWTSELLARPRILLLSLWIVLPLAVYFSASSKLMLYVLPVFSAFALLTARAMVRFMPEDFGFDYPTRRLWMALAAWGVLLLGLRVGAAYWPASKDEGLVWEAIREKLPPDCRRIVVVNEDLEGLRLYSGKEVIRTNTGDPANDRVDYQPFPTLEKGIEEARTPFAIIYVATRLKKAFYERMVNAIEKRNLQTVEFPLPHERVLAICSEKSESRAAEEPASSNTSSPRSERLEEQSQ